MRFECMRTVFSEITSSSAMRTAAHDVLHDLGFSCAQAELLADAGAAMVAALAFLISVAFAYASRTVVTWDTPFVPVALCLNALVGGPVLTLFCLRFSRWSPLESRVGGMLLALSSAALLANAGVYVAQGMSVLTMRNYLVSAEQLVPTYGAMATVFFLLAVAGVAVDALPLMRGRGISVASAAIASALVFAGIFVMRFAFYMMHMTYGISL